MSEENPPPVTCYKTLEWGVGESFGNLGDDQSSSGPHDEPNDFENMCVEKNESMESEVESNLTFLKENNPDDSTFEKLEEGGPISPLEDDIEDYFHIKKEKWEIVGPQFDYAPIYDTNKEDEVEISPPFLPGIIY